MNLLEKTVYNLVKNNPTLKNKIRNAYQSVYDILPNEPDYFYTKPIIRPGYYFGFHDVSPFSYDERKILANKLQIPLHMPEKSENLTVGYWNAEMTNYISLGETCAWNYHKGCRLQWVGNSNSKVIYNDFFDGHIGSIIIDFENKKKSKLELPVDTVSPNGNYATSFSYSRLNEFMPGYGYIHMDEYSYLGEKYPKNTGVYLIELQSSSIKLLCSLEELTKIKPEDSMRDAFHYVTHTEFSPDGEYIAFLHRWTKSADQRKYTRLITCKIDGTDVHVSPTSGMVSHYVWDDIHGILAYCQVNGVDGHYILGDYAMSAPKQLVHQLNSDGHQSYIPHSDYFVVDTYPDKRRRAKIYLANNHDDSVMKLVEVNSPKKFQTPTIYKHWACDLHPRVSPKGNYLCFDTVCTGERSMAVMKLPTDLLR